MCVEDEMSIIKDGEVISNTSGTHPDWNSLEWQTIIRRRAAQLPSIVKSLEQTTKISRVDLEKEFVV